MCGRFSNKLSWREIVSFYRLTLAPDNTAYAPRYNVAPSQSIPVLRTVDGERELVVMRWGLIPHWAKDPAIGNKLINARAETVAEKPSFRSAFRRRRCLIPASGFYEWQKTTGGTRQPWYIRLASGEPLSLAGLWEQWQPPGGDRIESCTIITTAANELLAPIHHRMPVILSAADHDAWLDPAAPSPGALLRSYEAEKMTAYPIGRLVNDPRNDDPACIEPLGQAVGKS